MIRRKLMFDPIPWRGQMCDRHLLALDGEDEDFDDWDDPEERYYREEIDDEGPLADLARLAVEIEAGRAEVPPRWKLDRPTPWILVWTTPVGRRYACDLNGELLPLP
jgi:hypothetical protein